MCHKFLLYNLVDNWHFEKHQPWVNSKRSVYFRLHRKNSKVTKYLYLTPLNIKYTYIVHTVCLCGSTTQCIYKDNAVYIIIFSTSPFPVSCTLYCKCCDTWFDVDSDVIGSGVGFVIMWDWKSHGICNANRKQTDDLIPAQRKRSALCDAQWETMLNNQPPFALHYSVQLGHIVVWRTAAAC